MTETKPNEAFVCVMCKGPAELVIRVHLSTGPVEHILCAAHGKQFWGGCAHPFKETASIHAIPGAYNPE